MLYKESICGLKLLTQIAIRYIICNIKLYALILIFLYGVIYEKKKTF